MRAMRKGVSRATHLLYPAFSYVNYTLMSDVNVAAAYAHLMSRDPARTAAPPNKRLCLLNFRPPIAGWKLLKLSRAPEEPRSLA